MFFVFNKEKIGAYIVSVVTVCLLFFIASTTMKETAETSTNITYNNTIITNNIEMNNTVK
ncbi:MAG: hypothetical protein IKF38_00270 [Clostridia bacterium]|nr:hypothetical protein [Clostridia bacterium]